MSRKAIESMTAENEFIGNEVDMASEHEYDNDSETEDEDGELRALVLV